MANTRALYDVAAKLDLLQQQQTYRDVRVARSREGCLCSHIGHLYRGIGTETDSSS